MPKEITVKPHGNVKYKPEFCESLIAWMAKGYSYSTWGVRPNPKDSISSSTLYDWEDKHPEWKEAKVKAHDAALQTLESMLISCAMGILPPELKNLKSRGVGINAVIFILKTRFHKVYSERPIMEHISGDSSLQVSFLTPPKPKEPPKDVNDPAT